MQTQVLGLSVDSEPCLLAWAESLDGITYPLLSDFFPHGEIAQTYGVLRSEGHSERAIFVIDKQGIIRYAQVYDIDKQPDNEELLRVLAEVDPQAAATAPSIDASLEAEPAADVVMYCTPWCPACKRARNYLDELGVEFVEINIARNHAAAEQVRQWADGNATTPTFNVKGKIIVQFDKRSINEALGLPDHF